MSCFNSFIIACQHYRFVSTYQGCREISFLADVILLTESFTVHVVDHYQRKKKKGQKNQKAQLYCYLLSALNKLYG